MNTHLFWRDNFIKQELLIIFFRRKRKNEKERA
jgi:hypothetical protein